MARLRAQAPGSRELLAQTARDLASHAGKLGVEAQLGRPWICERHVDLGEDTARPWRHDQDPRREKRRFADRVGHEQTGKALAREEAEQLAVEPFAGDLVQRTQTLVEQKDA